MQPSLEKKRVLIIGGSRGLGRGMSLALDAAGAKVFAVGRDPDSLEETRQNASDRLETIAGDATEKDFAVKVLNRFNPDIVILALGAKPLMKPLQDYPWESFSDNWNTDVKATFIWLQTILNMPMHDVGRILTVSSGAARQGSPLSGGYAAAKQAQRFLSDYMRGELVRQRRNIRIQCILPQLNPNTELGRMAVEAYAAQAGEEPSAYLRKRFGEVTLTPAIAGMEITRLLQDPSFGEFDEFMLTGNGLKPLAK